METKSNPAPPAAVDRSGGRPARPLDPRVRSLWMANGAIATVLLAIAAVAAMNFLDVLWWVPRWWLWLPAAAAAVNTVLAPPLRYRRWRYEIRSRDVYVSKGFLSETRTLVPFDRMQYVETQQGPLDRAFRLMQLKVYTAAGKAVQIPGLSVEEAEQIREELSAIAGTHSV